MVRVLVVARVVQKDVGQPDECLLVIARACEVNLLVPEARSRLGGGENAELILTVGVENRVTLGGVGNLVVRTRALLALPCASDAGYICMGLCRF